MLVYASEQGRNTDTLKCICQLMDADNEGSTSRRTKVMIEKTCWKEFFSYCKEHLCIIYVLKNIAVINNHFLILQMKYFIYVFYVWRES